ncbi:hypothetical protein L6R46_05620 [Myxococcota bacterium]|nr:hypothetical protein [Myxococcota bacterium]
MTSLVAWTARTPYSLLVTLVSALLSVALTWPLALTLSTESIGSPHGDGLKHLWTLWWIRAEVMAKGAIPFQTQLVNYPEGMALYPIEPLNGLLVVLLAPLSVVTVSNLAALANLTLIGVCGALLGRRVSGEPLGGLAAGVMLQTSAVALFTLHVGVGELQHLWWLPLGLLAWLNHKETQSFKSAVWLGLSLGLAALSCFYHGFFLGFSVAVLSLFTLPLRGSLPGVLLRYAVAAGLGLALVLPVMRTFSSSYGEDERPSVGLLAYITQEHGQPVTDPSSARLDPLDLVSPRRDERATASPERMGYGGGRYLGLPALALGLLALWRSPRQAMLWVVLALLGALLAMGSYLVVNGEVVELAGGSRVRLPFFFLNRALGYVAEPLNFPVRALAITMTALAVCAALVARAGSPRLALGLAVLAGLDVQINQLTPWPMQRFAPTAFPGLTALAEGQRVALGRALRTDDPRSAHPSGASGAPGVLRAVGPHLRHGLALGEGAHEHRQPADHALVQRSSGGPLAALRQGLPPGAAARRRRRGAYPRRAPGRAHDAPWPADDRQRERRGVGLARGAGHGGRDNPLEDPTGAP